MTAREVLDGIKDRLTKATPGPWEWDEEGFKGCGQVYTANLDLYGGNIAAPSGDLYPRSGYSPKDDMQFIAAAPVDMARLTRAVENVLAVADRLKSEAENAEHGARSAAEINDGAGLRAWESEKYVYQQAERLIRAAIEDALNPKEGQ